MAEGSHKRTCCKLLPTRVEYMTLVARGGARPKFRWNRRKGRCKGQWWSRQALLGGTPLRRELQEEDEGWAFHQMYRTCHNEMRLSAPSKSGMGERWGMTGGCDRRGTHDNLSQ